MIFSCSRQDFYNLFVDFITVFDEASTEELKKQRLVRINKTTYEAILE